VCSARFGDFVAALVAELDMRGVPGREVGWAFAASWACKSPNGSSSLLTGLFDETVGLGVVLEALGACAGLSSTPSWSRSASKSLALRAIVSSWIEFLG
jgi:hypothetical protein